MSCGIRVQLHEFPLALEKDMRRIDELWQEGLQKFGGPFLAGEDFTAVDAFYAPIAFRAQSYNLNFSSDSQSYLKRLLSLESMKTWYSEALDEPWIEPGHEKEVSGVGKIIEDFREKIS